MSISWGVKERFKFTAGGLLTSWDPPAAAAVYAVTSKQNPDRPKAHTILYVGQAEDLSREAHALNVQVLDAWKDGGHDARDLYVFVHFMPGSTNGQRTRVQDQLVSEYHPRCNR